MPLLWRKDWNTPETWGWSQGKGEETTALLRKCEKHIASQIWLKSLGRQLREVKPVHWPQSLLTETQPARNTVLLGASSYTAGWRAAPANCVTWRTSGWHSWITSLRCFTLVPDITLAKPQTPHTIIEPTLAWSPVELADERFTRSTCRHHLPHPLSPLCCKCSFSTQRLDKLKSSKVKWEIEIQWPLSGQVSLMTCLLLYVPNICRQTSAWAAPPKQMIDGSDLPLKMG